MFEHHSQPLLTRTEWLLRMAKSLQLVAAVIGVSLTIGILGYHFLGELPWIDALLESSMILGGMGSIAYMVDDTVKIFASFYALFSGLVLVAVMGIMLAPVLHRMMHHFHAEKHPQDK